MAVVVALVIALALGASVRPLAAQDDPAAATPVEESTVSADATEPPATEASPPAAVESDPGIEAVVPASAIEQAGAAPVDGPVGAASLGAAVLPVTLTLSPASPVLAGTSVTGQTAWASAPAGIPTGSVHYLAFSGAGCVSGLFADAGTRTVVASPGVNGSVPASDAVLFGSGGSFSWQAVYSGDGNYAQKTVCADLTVSKRSPKVGLTVSPVVSPMTAGGSATGAATLSGASASAGGSATYTVYAENTCTTQLSAANNPGTMAVMNGGAPTSAPIVLNQSGTVYWRAAYSGDGANNAAASGCIALSVLKTSPTATLTVAAATPPMLAGGSAAGSVALPGVTTFAGGTVTYAVYTTSACTTQVSPALVSVKTVAGGVAPGSDPQTFNAIGTFYWKAVYTGDADNNGASSACVALTVAKANPTVSLTLSAGSITAGSTATGSAALSGVGGTAGGSVVYAVFTTGACSTQVSPAQTSTVTAVNGAAPTSTASTFSLVGVFYWNAVYAGDANDNPAASACIALTVTKENPTVGLTVTPTVLPMLAAGSAKAQATLTNATVAAGGGLTYTIYSESSCTTVYVVSGNPNAKTVTNHLPAVSSTFTINQAGFVYWRAVYAGDTNNNAATGACIALAVGKSNPKLTMTVSATTSPMKVGGTATSRGSLSTTSPTAATSNSGGTITYTVYTESTCTTTLTATGNPSTAAVSNRSVSGSAKITINLAGTIYWRSVYNGDANNNAATSPCTAQTVAKSNATVTLTISPTSSPMKVGGTATGKVTMTLVGANAGGTLTYSVYSDSVCTATLAVTGSPSTVTVTNKLVPNSALTTISQVGTVYWRAAYAGDVNNTAAVSACIAQAIAKTTPTLTLTVAPSIAPMTTGGTAVGKTAMTLSTVAAGGSFVYTVYSDSACTLTLTATGSPSTVTVSNHLVPDSAPITITKVGTVYWKASYAGDGDNGTAVSTCVALTVAKTLPTLALSLAATTPPMYAGGTAKGAATLSAAATGAAGGSVIYMVYTDNACGTAVTPALTITKTVTNAVVPSSDPFTFNTVGTFYWKAVYSGDGFNTGATSACVALTVSTAGSTSISLTVSPNPLVASGAATGAATLVGVTGIAGGTVTYTGYANSLCSTQVVPNQVSVKTVLNAVVPNSNAVAFGTVGVVYWKAVYSGDANNLGTASPCVGLTVIKASPNLGLTIAPNPIEAGQTASGAAILTGGTGSIGGSVTYAVYTTNTCTTQVSPAKTSTKTVVGGAVPTSGAFTFVALGTFYWGSVFSGDAANNPATSPCVALPVTRVTPSLSLLMTPNPVNVGDDLNVSLTLSPDADSPTGTVTLRTYTDVTCITPHPAIGAYVANLSGGAIPSPAALVINTSDPVYRQATYSGDANNAPTATDCMELGVNAGPLTASIVSASLSPVVYSNTVTVGSGQLVILVGDGRDTGEGWSVTVVSGDFVYGGSSPNGAAISAAGLSVTGVGAPVAVSGQALGAGGPVTDGLAFGGLDQARTVVYAQAGFGAGRYRQTVPIALTIPGQSQAGSYTATLTVSTTAAP